MRYRQTYSQYQRSINLERQADRLLGETKPRKQTANFGVTVSAPVNGCNCDALPGGLRAYRGSSKFGNERQARKAILTHIIFLIHSLCEYAVNSSLRIGFAPKKPPLCASSCHFIALSGLKGKGASG